MAIIKYEMTKHFFKAVVDWIEFEIQTENSTHAWRIPKAIEGVSFVTACDPDTGEAFPANMSNTPTTLFRPRIQDPKCWADVRQALESTARKFPLVAIPKVIAIEIAFDAYSLDASREELAEIAARFYKFQTHPVSNVQRLYRDYKGSGQAIPNHFSSLVRGLADGWQIGIGHHRDDPCGRWKADTQAQHIYVKTSDSGGQEIPANEHRARIEITLRGSALLCQTLEEWACFKFESLSGYFNFRKLKQGLNPFELLAAEASVNIGERHKRNRKGGGTRLHSKLTIADTALNQKARGALRELSRRWQSCSKYH